MFVGCRGETLTIVVQLSIRVAEGGLYAGGGYKNRFSDLCIQHATCPIFNSVKKLLIFIILTDFMQVARVSR